MSFINDFSVIAEKFFLCTHVPVSLFTPSFQYTADLRKELPHCSNEFISRLQKSLFSFRDNCCKLSYAPYHFELEGYHFTALLTNQYQSDSLCLMGPYQTRPDLHASIVFKPLECLDFLINLFHDIVGKLQKDKCPCLTSDSPYIQKILNYIDLYYTEDIKLEDLAIHVGLNKCYICHILKKELGKTFSELLNHKRIAHSKELLAHTQDSILDIALCVGFNNQSYYAMMFKKLVGQTPAQYRNKKSLLLPI